MRNSNRRGVALIFVLALLLMLGGLATDIWRSARLDARIVESLRARTVARYAAESGIEVALASLRTDAHPNLMNVPIGEARFGVVITNLNARIDLGRTDSATVRGLFQQYTSESQARAIARELVEHPLQRVGELALMKSVPEDVAPYVTLWGDGTIDTTAAPPPVRAALSTAAALVDRPSRLLLVARGWRQGFPLTHEIQAVYDVQGPSPALVAWQERDL